MYKKKLQRLGAVCLAAAMVFTTFSFPDAVKAEEGTATQAETEAETATELEQGKVTVKIDQSILKANAMTNSEEVTNERNAAKNAFDGNFNTKWCTAWREASGSYHYEPTWLTGTDFETTQPWIGSGFGRTVMLKKLTYQTRETNVHNIKTFELYISENGTDWSRVDANNLTTPNSDGSLSNNQSVQEIILTEAKPANYFKIVSTSTWMSNGANAHTVSATEINAYEEKDMDVVLTAPTTGSDPTVSVPTEVEAKKWDASAQVAGEITGGVVVDDNAFDLSESVTVGEADDAKFTGTGAKYMVQFKVRLTNIKKGNVSILVRKEGQYDVRINYKSDGTAELILLYTNYNSNGDEINWCEAKVTVSDLAAWINKDVTITAVRNGNDSRIWYNDTAGVKKTAENFNAGNKESTPLTIGGSASVTGAVKDLVVLNCGSVSNNYVDTKPTVDGLLNSGATYAVNLKATPASKAAYTAAISSSEETSNEKKIYTTSTTITATENGEILVAPEAVTVNIDGNTAHNQVVPVSEASTLTDTGSTTVKYIFEDMFVGGSLRIDNTDPLVKTNMRLGYDFKIPSDTTFKGCEWYYGTASDNLSLKLAPTTTKYITNPGGKGNDVYRSNIVFTNMPKSAYKKNACARVLVKYGDGEHTYSKMGLGIDTRTVYEVATAVKNDLETHGNTAGNTYEYVKRLVEAADVQ